MTAVEVANAAGVSEFYVRKLRETRKSNDQIDSESRKQPEKVKTKRGLRPKQYRTKKKREKEQRERQQQAMRDRPGPIQWPTREQNRRAAARADERTTSRSSRLDLRTSIHA